MNTLHIHGKGEVQYRDPTGEEMGKYSLMLTPRGDADTDAMRTVLAFYDLGRAVIDGPADDLTCVMVGRKLLERTLEGLGLD